MEILEHQVKEKIAKKIASLWFGLSSLLPVLIFALTSTCEKYEDPERGIAFGLLPFVPIILPIMIVVLLLFITTPGFLFGYKILLLDTSKKSLFKVIAYSLLISIMTLLMFTLFIEIPELIGVGAEFLVGTEARLIDLYQIIQSMGIFLSGSALIIIVEVEVVSALLLFFLKSYGIFSKYQQINPNISTEHLKERKITSLWFGGFTVFYLSVSFLFSLASMLTNEIALMATVPLCCAIFGFFFGYKILLLDTSKKNIFKTVLYGSFVGILFVLIDLIYTLFSVTEYYLCSGNLDWFFFSVTPFLMKSLIHIGVSIIAALLLFYVKKRWMQPSSPPPNFK